MVGTLALFVAIGYQVSTPSEPKLSFKKGSFVAQSGKNAHSTTHKRQTMPPPSSTANFRKDDVFAVWDSRGLSLRKGSTVSRTRLAGFCQDERWFSKLEVSENKLLLEYGGYDADADQLLAQRRFGSLAFLVLRWLDPIGNPWFDGLVQINLAAPKLAPFPIARFQGARIPRNTQVIPIVGKELVLFESLGSEWNVVRVGLDHPNKTVRKRHRGTLLDLLLGPGNLAMFVEGTEDGHRLAGWLSLIDGTRSNLFETSGEFRSLDSNSPAIGIVRNEEGRFAVCLETGAKLKIPVEASAKRIGPYFLMWIGGSAPTSAEIFEPTRMRKVASWQEPKPPSKPPAKRPK